MTWFDLPFFRSPEWCELQAFLARRRCVVNVYPGEQAQFRALELTPLDALRIVILGQDPYHRPGQAHGLCFSVPDGIPPPPSLRNILKELQRDLAPSSPVQRSSDLSDWAEQGILLLNSSLTVEEGTPGSHAGRGWELLTDQMIATASEQHDHLLFMLWGKPAQSKRHLIAMRHTLLEAPHPSPLSAHRGFHGCGHFSAANAALSAHGQKPVQWLTLPFACK